MAKFKNSISDYGYYIDFEKVYRNIDLIKVELNILNSLIGSKDIENDFKNLVSRYPETLKCIPLLLAVRENEIYAIDSDGEFRFSFRKANYSMEKYMEFMQKTGLDSNGRKKRGGYIMENLVESYLVKAGFIKDITYFRPY